MSNKVTNNSNLEKTNPPRRSLISINDLREKEYSNTNLSFEERVALKNYDRFRISELNKQTSEEAFHNKYMQLQVMANLSPYQEFLKENYFI